MRKITYLEDAPVGSPKGDHWLSLAHGPAPDFIGLIRYKDQMVSELYRGAVWISADCFFVVIEMAERDRPYGEEEWVRKFLHGWIAQTYRWRPVEDGYACEDLLVEDPEEGHEDQALRDMLVGCVDLATKGVEE